MSESNKDLTAPEMLREARTIGRRKREIATISRLLCIREEYLIALENGDYASIPEVVYTLGFARNYAMELGLDPDEIVTKIKRELGLIDEGESPADDDSKEEPTPSVLSVPKKATDGTKIGLFSKVSTSVYRHWKGFLGCLIALGIVIAAITIFFSLGNEAETVNPVETVNIVVKEPVYSQAVREKFGNENRDTAKVILQATQETWVKIEDARGNTAFSRVLVPGDVYYVPDGDKYKGTFGNAGGIDVWVDGKLAPKLGALHTRKTGILMTPNSLMPVADAATPAVVTE